MIIKVISPYRINLQGIAIGNGVTDYFIQGPSFAEYAYTHSLISLAAKQRIDREWTQCLEEVCMLPFIF